MEYGTIVQEYADEEYGLNSDEYYLTPAGGTQQFFKLYVWNTNEDNGDDTADIQQQLPRHNSAQQQDLPPLAQSFDARLLCEYSYSTDTFRWESTSARTIPGFDQAIADLTIRSLQESNICPTANLFRDIINYPFDDVQASSDNTSAISCRDSTGDMACWLVSYLILSKQSQPVAIYTASMNNGEGRAWFLLSNPQGNVPVPQEAVEMQTKTKELLTSNLSQRPKVFGLGPFAKTKDTSSSETEEDSEEADTRRFFLERLFSINPDTQGAAGVTAVKPGVPQFASPETDTDFETSVLKYGQQLQEYLYQSYELHSYDNFEIVPAWDDPKQFLLYFFKEDSNGKMKILQFKLHELCALLYPEQAFWCSLEPDDDDMLSAARSLKLRSHSDACQPGDSRLFYLIANALTKGSSTQQGLQLSDLQPEIFGQAFEDFGWFFSFLLGKSDSRAGIVSIPTENKGTETEPDFGGPLENPGRAWYALEEMTGQPHLVPSELLSPSTAGEYEQAICHASRVQSALMGDLYDITADTNIYLDTKEQKLYCWNDDLTSSVPVSELKGKRFTLSQVGSFSYSDSTFAFPEDPAYWLKSAIMDLEVRSREKDNSLFVALVDAFRAGGRVGIPNDIGDSIGWLLASICLAKADEGLSILPDKPLILGKHEMIWYILSKPEQDVGIPSEALAGKKKMQDLA